MFQEYRDVRYVINDSFVGFPGFYSVDTRLPDGAPIAVRAESFEEMAEIIDRRLDAPAPTIQ